MSEEGEQPDMLLVEAHDLIFGLIEGRITVEQMKRLSALARQDARVREMYVTYQCQRCILAALARPATPQLLSTDSMHEAQVMEAISRESAEAEKDEVRPVRPLPLPMLRPNDSAQAVRAIGARGWAAAAAAFIAMSGLIFFLSRPHNTTVARMPTPVNRPVLATLSRVIDAQWVNVTPGEGDTFDSATDLTLTGGYAEFTFASGADMVVQAPAEIVIQSDNSVTLRSGKLAATVPPPAVGFSVSAGQSVITDLGTEFGVNESAAGTEVEVFKGKVTAQAPSTRPALLVANDAAKIDLGGELKVDRGGAVPQRYVRQLRTSAPYLDLVDLVAGGDGTTSRRGPAIDAKTGEYGNLPPIGDTQATAGYHRISLAAIDGCFVPNTGRTQIDSAGHRFAFSGATGITFNNILAGNKTSWPNGWGSRLTAVLGGVDYSVAPHGFLFMHANSGLTFDLKAIAALHPDNRITGLHCVAGNPSLLGLDARGQPMPPVIDSMYVIVDGKVRFQKLDVSNVGQPVVVDVPLSNADHFLTLASSKNGSDIKGAWMIIADPRINLSGPSANEGVR